jgi:hypothetical protein
MEEERSSVTRALITIGFGLLAFAITIVAGGIWSALLVTTFVAAPRYLGPFPRWRFCCG